MIYVVAIGIGVTVTLLVSLFGQLMVAQPREVRQRLVVVAGTSNTEVQKKRREERLQKVRVVLESVGSEFEERFAKASHTRQWLMNAGYRHPQAPALYWGGRITATLVGSFGMMFLGTTARASAPLIVFLMLYMAAMGWFGPYLVVSLKKRRRQKGLQKALADALDLLVVCVEAGLGLNQALLRVAGEIGHISEAMSLELSQVNLEIRAGSPRAEALQNLANRTGLPDIQSLVTMLIQTDRFGTSIARSLRVHSDTVREKRRQAAEEASAKTTIKLVFPLVICIFPALLLVVMGGGVIRIIEALGSM